MVRSEEAAMRLRMVVSALVLLVFATGIGAALPFPQDLLNGKGGEALKEVVENSTLHREVGGIRLTGREAVFEYLLDHPDFAATLARSAGVLKYTVERRGEGEYWADDHKGITGRLAMLQAEVGRRIFYAEGIYEKGILRIPGRMAMVVTYAEREDPEGSPYVEGTLSGYIKLDSFFFDPMARLLRPLVAGVMEKRAARFFRKADRLLEILSRDPESLMGQLPPDEWKVERETLRSLLKNSEKGLEGL
jgi:hypothetical protein